MDESEDETSSGLRRLVPGLSLLVRIWVDGSEGRQPVMRGYVSILGGDRIGSFNSHDGLFELIKRATKTLPPDTQENEGTQP